MKELMKELTMRVIIVLLASVWCYGMMSMCTNFQLDMLAVAVLSSTIATGYVSIKKKKSIDNE